MWNGINSVHIPLQYETKIQNGIDDGTSMRSIVLQIYVVQQQLGIYCVVFGQLICKMWRKSACNFTLLAEKAIDFNALLNRNIIYRYR